tara:strand:+ start:4461 stop:6137 length:1677 start_codon:yes stop_codon:yes gene_type:complete
MNPFQNVLGPMGINSVTNEMKFDNTGVGKFYNRNYKPESLAEEFPFLARISSAYEETLPNFSETASKKIEKQIQGLLPQAIVPDVVPNQQKDEVGIKPPLDISGLYESTSPAFESKGRGTPKIEEIGVPAFEEKGRGTPPTAEETAFAQGLDAYINAARGTNAPAPDVKSLDEYKEIFSKITGVDVSGKIDKSAALMSFGLALMQNRAGKGFNLGRILGEVGKAGEIALPKLEQAKANAQAAALAGGKYALEQRSSDEAQARAAKEKGMARSNYYVVPKGKNADGSPSSFIANLDQGTLQALSPYELNALYNTEGFNEKYTVVDGSMYSSIITEAMKTPEAEQIYDTKSPRKMELLGEGASDLFTIETWRALPGSGKENLLVGTGTDTYNALSKAAIDIQKAKKQFIEGMELAEGVNIFRFGIDKLDRLGETLGVNFKPGINNTDKLRFILNRLQAQNAPEILGEAGKTISDADRQRVAQIVGDLNAGSTADELMYKMEQLFNDIIIKKEQDILAAIGTLDRYTGRNIAATIMGSSDDLSEEDEKERVTELKKLGIEP